MIGLKTMLHNKIKEYKGEMMPYDEVALFCISHRYRISNGERRLRPSESKKIETIYNDKGHIKGYKIRPEYIGMISNPEQTANSAL